MADKVSMKFGRNCYVYLKDDKNIKPATSVLTKHEKNVNFVVCWGGINRKTQKPLRLFFNFSTNNDFFAFLDSKVTDLNDWVFYEVYMKEYHKGIKLFYDIDIDLTKEENKNIDYELAEGVKSEIIEKTIEELSFLNLKPEDFSVYITHRETKFSYHILLQGYYFRDNEVIKHIAKNVKNRCHEWIKPFFDESVYKSVQQLRLIYNKKCGTNVNKIECNTFMYNDKIIKPKISGCLNSLITNVEDCKYINIDIEELPKNVFKSNYIYNHDMNTVIKTF